MIVVGLVGGVASGKSSVALDFRKLGACILDGDRIGHEVLGLTEVKDRLIERWGDVILTDDGQIDRRKVAAIVFGDAADAQTNLNFLESITHPKIKQRLVDRLEQLRQSARFPLVVLDAAVMFKSGWDSLCSKIIFVDAPRELRIKRAQLRGLSVEQFEAREKAQMSTEKKKKRSDIVIDNSGRPQTTFNQVEEVWQSLLQIA